MTGFFIFTVILHCEILFRHCFAFSSHLTFLFESACIIFSREYLKDFEAKFFYGILYQK